MTENKGTVNALKHESEILKDNPLGDPFVRDLYVYTPPNYVGSDKSYPVVYCLSGFGGRGKKLLNDSPFSMNLAERLDMLINEERIKPMIVVMPDCFTKYGGSQYLNSTATGRYEDYLTDELVPFVDKNFRTINDKNFRAVTGRSSGGYASLIMAMRHSDIFGLATSNAGDCYFDYCYKADFPKAFKSINGKPFDLLRRFYDEEANKGKYAFEGINIIGMSACYSPNENSEWGFDLPFNLKTGELRIEVWQRWLEHDPIQLVQKHVEDLKSLKLLYLDAGTRDEFALDIGAKILVERLNKHQIPHLHEEFDGGHFNTFYRYNRALELISENFN